MPTTVSATAFATSASSRKWLSASPSESRLDLLRTNANILATLNSTDLHSVHLIHDKSPRLGERVTAAPDLTALGIYAPEVSLPDASGKATTRISGSHLTAWTSSLDLPPSPHSRDLWLDDPPPSQVDNPNNPYSSAIQPQPALISADKRQANTLGGYMLAPRAFRCPIGADLPIGLVLDPTKVSLDALRQIIAYATGDNDMEKTAWLFNPWFTGWYQAVAHDPAAFIVPLILHETFTRIFSAPAPDEAISLRLHLEWDLANQYNWDYVFASCTQPVLVRLLKYGEALINDANCASDSTLVPIMGPADSVWRLPYMVRYRPPSTKSWLGDYKWRPLIDAPSLDLPRFQP